MLALASSFVLTIVFFLKFSTDLENPFLIFNYVSQKWKVSISG